MKYISYQKKYADGIAKLWNESIENWPEGIGLELEKNVEDIEKELSLGGYLKIILALSEKEEVLGYCDLKPSPVFREVCYIETLNVHPKYQGLSIGRQLLKRIIEFAVNKGYRRIDAFTWSSNTKAISLYKKMGFFWQPNTSVQMVNFIPVLFNTGFLNINLIKKWDELLCVKPDFGPDRFQIGGREYYPYLFKYNQNLLEIRIDKLSQSVFFYKTKSAFFMISTPGLMLPENDHIVKIKTRGFRINNVRFSTGREKFKINVAQNTIIIPSEIQTLGEEPILTLFAQRGSLNFEFGIGFYKGTKIEPLDKSQLITSRMPQVGFRKLVNFKAPFICRISIEKVMRKPVEYQISETNELFTIDISDILALLPIGVYKIKFVFEVKSKKEKIATVERYLIKDNSQIISYARLGTDILIWLKNCCCFIKNPGAKLVIQSHNLIDRGVVFANYDSISNREIGTQQFNLQCYYRNDKIIIRAVGKRLTKIFVFANPGSIVVNYKMPKLQKVISTTYLMEESALLKIGTWKKPITMMEEDCKRLIRQSNRFQLLLHSLKISCTLHKEIAKVIQFMPHRITYEIDSPSKNIIPSTAWHVKVRNKRAITSFKKAQTLIANGKVDNLLKNNFICATECLSMSVDPGFGPVIYSLKWNNEEVLLTPYPKVANFGETYPWYGGLYTVGCLADRKVIDSFEELCLEEKTEMYSIISHYNHKDISGILIKSHMNRVSGLKSAFLYTYYFLLPYELVVITKFENESRIPIPCYFSSIAYIKPISDMVLISDIFTDRIMLNKEHFEIPAEKIIRFKSHKKKCVISYLLYCNLCSNLKVINLANKKGFNLILRIKDYFKPSDFIVQYIRFREVKW